MLLVVVVLTNNSSSRLLSQEMIRTSQSVSVLIVGCKTQDPQNIAAIVDLPSNLLETRIMGDGDSELTFSERVEEIRGERGHPSDDDVAMGPAKTIAIVVGGLFGIGMVIGALTSSQPVIGLFVVLSMAFVVLAVIGYKNSDEVMDGIQEANKRQKQVAHPKEKINCRECGWQNPRNNDFCHDCGEELIKANE